MNTESFNTSLLDHLTSAVLVLDSDFCLYHLNPAAEELFKTSDKRSHNAYIGDLLYRPESTLRALRNVQKHGNTYIARKTQLILANRTKLLVDYAVTAINDLEQDFLLVEIQELDRSYNISRGETLISNHETTLELVRNLGHEIKNPLGGIRGAAQLLALELPNSELQDYTNVIISETDRLVNLVDRLTGSYKKPVLAKHNIHEIVERVSSLIEAESQGGIHFVRDYDPSIPEFTGDVEQLIQAVLNIVRNAMQALQESNHEDPHIILKTRTLSHATIGPVMHKLIARIEIIDNGPGIPAEILETVFYPLITGRANGTGLGLSIAQTILKQHNGLIECESQEGQTRFILSIPLSDEGKQL